MLTLAFSEKHMCLSDQRFWSCWMLCKEQPKDRIQLFCLSFGKRQKEELENVEKKNNIRAEGGQSIV